MVIKLLLIAVLELKQKVSCFPTLWRILLIFRKKKKDGETDIGRE